MKVKILLPIIKGYYIGLGDSLYQHLNGKKINGEAKQIASCRNERARSKRAQELNPNRLIIIGVIVPTKDENKTTQNKAKDTITDNWWLLKNR